MPSGVPAGGGAFICRSSASMTAAWRSITLRASAASPASFWRSRSFSLPRRRASVSISRSRVSMVPILASERRVQTFSAMSGPASSASIPPWTAGRPPPPAVSHTASTTSTTAAMTENSTSCRRRTAPASPSTALIAGLPGMRWPALRRPALRIASLAGPAASVTITARRPPEGPLPGAASHAAAARTPMVPARSAASATALSPSTTCAVSRGPARSR